MTVLGFLLLLLIAAVCGSIGQSIAGYSLGGCVVTIAVGFIGALLGKWIATQLNLSYLLPVTVNGETFPVIWAIMGAAIFSLTIGVISRRKQNR